MMAQKCDIAGSGKHNSPTSRMNCDLRKALAVSEWVCRLCRRAGGAEAGANAQGTYHAAPGRMFALRRNKLVGSYRRLSWRRR